MAKLLAKSPCGSLLPLNVADCTLQELSPLAITSVAPLRGQEKQVSAALKTAHGLTFPAPGRATGKDGCRCIWFGQNQAFLVGPVPKSIKGAAQSDQSDGWAVMRLTGQNAEAVLARLAPVDLNVAVFKRGHTVRTLLNHMAASITRTGTQTFDIMVFRSMAHTAVHEFRVAMVSVGAQT